MSRLVSRAAASFAAAAALIVASTAAPAVAAPPTPLNYVNFGDSYSAGWGAYAPAASQNANFTEAPCGIGGRPDQVTKFGHLHSVTLVGDYACAGATIGTPTNPMEPVPTIGQQIEKAALDGALNSSTDLITLTAGGNDVGFAKFVATCAADPTPTADDCRAFAAAGTLAARALDVQGTVYAIHYHAQHAQIAWIGYPHIFALAGEPTTVLPGGGILSPAAAAVFDAGVDTLNAVLAIKAAEAHVTFVDVTAQFTGHEIGSSDSWFNFVPAGPLSRFNLHPTARGYLSGYYPVMVSQLKPAQLVRS